MILLFPPSVPSVLALLAIAGGEALLRSDPAEALFNLGQGALSATAGVLCFAAVRGLGAPDPADDPLGGLAAAVAASAALYAANTTLVAGAAGANGRKDLRASFVGVLGFVGLAVELYRYVVLRQP